MQDSCAPANTQPAAFVLATLLLVFLAFDLVTHAFVLNRKSR